MRFLNHLLFPAALFVSIASFELARLAGLPLAQLEAVLLASGLATLGTALLLENHMPYRRDWQAPRGDRLTDWLSFGVLAGVADPLVKWGLPLLAVAAYSNAQTSPSFLAELPFYCQVMVALLLSELGKYWSHRWHHASPRLWWLHALHHSSERLYSVNNFRYHPLNFAINQTLGLLPLMLLGVPPVVLLGVVTITQPVLMLQHSNLPLQHGWLNAIFSTNQMHRAHHANTASTANHNFGNALLAWDWVFGTYLALSRGAAVKPGDEQIGLFSPAKYPSRAPYWQQLTSMFTPQCCKA
jgi:ornithine lipid hydroxylase